VTAFVARPRPITVAYASVPNIFVMARSSAVWLECRCSIQGAAGTALRQLGTGTTGARPKHRTFHTEPRHKTYLITSNRRKGEWFSVSDAAS
jgi:hypothetical protein